MSSKYHYKPGKYNHTAYELKKKLIIQYYKHHTPVDVISRIFYTVPSYKIKEIIKEYNATLDKVKNKSIMDSNRSKRLLSR